MNSQYMQSLMPEFDTIFDTLRNSVPEFGSCESASKPKRAPIYDSSELEMIDNDVDENNDDDDDNDNEVVTAKDVPTTVVVADKSDIPEPDEIPHPRLPALHRTLQKTVTLALPGHHGGEGGRGEGSNQFKNKL